MNRFKAEVRDCRSMAQQRKEQAGFHTYNASCAWCEGECEERSHARWLPEWALFLCELADSAWKSIWRLAGCSHPATHREHKHWTAWHVCKRCGWSAAK